MLNYINNYILFFCIFIFTTSVNAAVSQSPLLNQPKNVAPNLVLIMDDSGSMDFEQIYKYKSVNDDYSNYLSAFWPFYSPDVNKIYYDPRIRYKPRKDYLGNDLSAPLLSSRWTGWWMGFLKNVTSDNAENLTNQSLYHNPYTPDSTQVVPVGIGSYPRWADNDTDKYPKFINRTDCTSFSNYCTWNEELRNYSNWYAWYSTRGKMAITSLTHAFQTVSADTIRLGYGTINKLRSTDSKSGNRLEKGVSTYNTTTKQNFYNWLEVMNFSGGTPNLEAVDDVGQYYSRSDSDGPWGTNPNPDSSTVVSPSTVSSKEAISSHASCRRSYTLLVTDGYWNYSGNRRPSPGNIDGNTYSVTRPSGGLWTYAPISPYKDSYQNTLADIVMKYWVTDLRQDIANKVPAINSFGINNPSFWQNVSFYGITLGLSGLLDRTTTEAEVATRSALEKGTIQWPEPKEDEKSTVDDFWHATINGQGDLLNANNSTELTAGLNTMFSAIAGTPQTLSGVAVSAAYLKSGTRKYKPEYISGTWSGRLSAIELDAVTGNDKVPTNIYWQVEKGTDGKLNPISTIPTHDLRNIVTWTGSSAVNFNITSNNWTLVTGETRLTNDELNYIRGDFSKESRNSVGTFRNRDARLGDIVNSSPVYIKDNLNMGYSDSLFPGYSTFLADKAKRPDGVLIVGANDGMLHAFHNKDGKETFAFIPQAVRPKLKELTKSNYSHQYYVDGPNVEVDAYLNSAWRNMVIGSTGAGAKSVYALEIAKADPTLANSISVRWEANAFLTDYAELGHVTTEVQAGQLADGTWVAIFGNGFDSTSGHAKLFIANLATGALIHKIDAETSGNNGLIGVKAVMNSEKKIIGAYAGDLKGNLWKFDLSGNGKANWKVDLNQKPLYVSKDKDGNLQPITATPTLIPHPQGGYVVTFGTGKFVDASDVLTANYKTQSFYGIWDRQNFGANVANGASFTGRTQLQEQTISTVAVTTTIGGQNVTTNFFKISNNKVDWGEGLDVGKRGWHIDLLPSTSGQRTVYPFERLTGTMVLATTLSQTSATSADICVTSGSGTGWAYIFDGLTGAGPSQPLLDTNADGKVNSTDSLVSGWQDVVDGKPTAINTSTNGKAETYCIVTGQSTCMQTQVSCGQSGANACPGAALSGLKTREWRQLFMR